MKKRMLLYFGSFDPVHNGHIALAEYAIEKNLADEVALVISPQNPFKADILQTPEYTRYEMTDMACKASKYPERIKPSVVEFVLEKPSYTINTLDYLKEITQKIVNVICDTNDLLRVDFPELNVKLNRKVFAITTAELEEMYLYFHPTPSLRLSQTIPILGYT